MIGRRAFIGTNATAISSIFYKKVPIVRALRRLMIVACQTEGRDQQCDRRVCSFNMYISSLFVFIKNIMQHILYIRRVLPILHPDTFF